MTDLPKLWDHQSQAIERARTLPYFALFMEPGCGKSRTTIEILRERFNGRRALMRTIIFAPPIVLSNWKVEFAKFSKIDQSKVTVLKGTVKQRLEIFNREAQKGPHIFITNYETLLMADLFQAFKVWNPEVLIFDESHRVKESKAKRTKLADVLANPKGPKPLVYLLSGSPVLNSPMDLFSQFRIMDGGRALGDNFFAFRARYFQDKNAGMPKDRYFPNWVVQAGALEDLNARIMGVSCRVEKKDCLTLPPYVRQTITVDMSADQEKAYKEMKRDFLTYVNDKACIASLAIVKALRLMQICSGFISVEGESETQAIAFKTDTKIAALEEILTELAPNHKVIVWAVWKHNYKAIRELCEKLNLGFAEVHGDISAKEKEKSVERFNTDESCRVFIGHPGAGGVGINLVVASYSVFFSRTFSQEHSVQAEARNYRGGSLEQGHAKVTRIDLVCAGTIDETIISALDSKTQISHKLIQDNLSLEQ